MSYDKKTVRSRPGLSQEEALTSLQDHPLYRPGTKIASIRRRGDRWVAELLEPKTAGELEDESGDEEGPAEELAAPKKKKPAFADDGGDDDGDSDDGGPDIDGPPGAEGGDSPGGKGGEKAEVAQLLHMVQQIADALGIAPTPDAGMGGPDDLGPGPGGPGGPPAPPHGAPGGLPPGGPPGGPGDPQEIHHKTKLGPGEVPPGGTPLGAPSFSHTRQANPGAPGGASSIGVPLPQSPAPAPTASQGCPHGYPDSSSCPQCAAQGGIGSGAPVPGSGPVVGRARTFVASKRTNVTLHQAKVALEAEFGPRGYHVGQIKRDENDASIVRAMLVANGR